MIKLIDGLGAVGVVADANYNKIPENSFSDALNVRFCDGYVGRISGNYNPVTSTNSVHVFLQYVNNGTFTSWIYCAGGNVYSAGVAGTAPVDITRLNAFFPVPDPYTVDPFSVSCCFIGGIFVFNIYDGSTAPQFWNLNTATKTANLTSWPAFTAAKSVRTFKNYLIALNITKSGTRYPQMVKWSAAAVPGSLPSTWDPTDATKDAGELDLADTQSEIIDGLSLGDVFIVYKRRSYYSLEYVGPPYIFRAKKIYEGAGVAGLNCVVDTPIGHVVFGYGDIFYHNGGKPVSIVTGRVRKKVFNDVSSVNYSACFVAHNPRMLEVWFCYPKKTSSYADKALIWNYEKNTLTFRDIQNFTCAANIEVSVSGATEGSDWATRTPVWDGTEGRTYAEQSLVFGTSSDKFYMVDFSDTFGATSVSGYLEKRGMDFGDAKSKKLISGVRVHGDGPSGSSVTIYLGTSSTLGGSVTWSPATSFSLTQNDYAKFNASGRFISIRIETSSNIRITSIEFDYSIVGPY